MTDKPKMTRKRALELAQECVQKEMAWVYERIYRPSPKNPSRDNCVDSERYAELAAALKLIEHMARQKELL